MPTWSNASFPNNSGAISLLILATAFKTPFPIQRFLSPSRSSIASFSPVEAPDGTAARPHAPLSSVTSASTVGFPRESKICRPLISRIALILPLLRLLKKANIPPAQPRRTKARLFPIFVLGSRKSSTGTRPPHHSAAHRGLVLLIRRTVRPRGYASGFLSPAASLAAFLSSLSAPERKLIPPLLCRKVEDRCLEHSRRRSLFPHRLLQTLNRFRAIQPFPTLIADLRRNMLDDN